MTHAEADEPTVDCAVRKALDAEGRRALAAHLGQPAPSGITEFAAKDDDELNAALISSRFRRVVFADLEALLTMLWKDHADLARWLAAGVQVELAKRPDDCEEQWLPALVRASESLKVWRRSERKRKIVAGAILSLFALLAAGVVLLVAAR